MFRGHRLRDGPEERDRQTRRHRPGAPAREGVVQRRQAGERVLTDRAGGAKLETWGSPSTDRSEDPARGDPRIHGPRGAGVRFREEERGQTENVDLYDEKVDCWAVESSVTRG